MPCIRELYHEGLLHNTIQLTRAMTAHSERVHLFELFGTNVMLYSNQIWYVTQRTARKYDTDS